MFPYSQSYCGKYENFREQLQTNRPVTFFLVLTQNFNPVSLKLNLQQFEFSVRRDKLFEDSHWIIMGISEKDNHKLKSTLHINFTGESGLDYGGLAK